MAEQEVFAGVEFAENPEPRCPCVLLLDTSGSMQGNPIGELNAGLQQYRDELLSDSLAAKRVEVAVVTFGPVNLAHEFCTADAFQPPTLVASGDTPLGAAINLGLDLVEQRKQAYKAGGVAYYRPWIFLITDGAPTDEWSAAAARIREGEQRGAFAFFSVGVAEADMDTLARVGTRQPLKLSGLKFRELFRWLSNSQKSVSRSTPGDKINLENPTAGPEGWATV